MNLLFIGPPATGKSTAALDQFRAEEHACLIVPTATMAEHVRHQVARTGFPARPSRIGTLANFLERWGTQWELPPPVPRQLLHLLIADALQGLKPARFAALLDSSALHAALAELIEEAPPGGHPLASLFENVRSGTAAYGYALPATRLLAAAAAIRAGLGIIPGRIIIDGFFTLGPAQLEFIEALANRASITIVLPQALGAGIACARLEAAGFRVQRFIESRRRASRELLCANTPEREAEQIARRILHYAAQRRPFRDMAIVLRSREPYASIVETALARFGVPARAYFTNSLASHPAVAFLGGIVHALIGGWTPESMVPLIRMPVSGIGATAAGDRLDFDLRAQMPGVGTIPAMPSAWSKIPERWRTERCAPQGWAEKLKALSKLIPAPMVPEAASARDQVDAWRSTAAATRGLFEILDRTATLLPHSESMPLAQFWKYVETGLALEQLRINDRRRDVVHIMDVFEARQWEIPIVFVCGLLERMFPEYHREDPLLGDSIRRRLGMSTAAQRQREERFLYEIALTRATERTILSFPRFNEKGEETIPSFFLEGAPAETCDQWVRPPRSRPVVVPAPGDFQDPALKPWLARIHRKLSPTSIESFLQCPFQLFARKTLNLTPRPPAPRDRLTMLVEGQIIHRALAEWARAPLLGAQVLAAVFEQECAQLRVPETYRKEAVRLELLRNFESFLAAPRPSLGSLTYLEQDFRFDLRPGLTISGRIDRVDVDRQNRALVTDYKYSAGSKIRERVGESEEGNLVQGGLYLLAAECKFGLIPAGMLYCGLKKDVSWGGWHLAIPGLERIGESRLPEALRELMNVAAQSAVSVHDAILSGRIGARPRDSKKCNWCDYRDTCRVETIPEERVLTADRS